LIANNSRTGIELGPDSSNNLIFGNAIGWNAFRNAEDAGTDNSWDDGVSLGNWWSDFNSTESDVYEIEGRANSQDNYPQVFHSWTTTLPLQSGEIGVEIFAISGIAVVIIFVLIIVVLRRRKIV
jgi:hypothetical protein